MEKLLKEKLDSFKKYISTGKSYQEVYDAYEMFYKWLFDRVVAISTDEEGELLLSIICEVYNSSTKWAKKNNIKFKSYSKQWNWKLVKRVGTFVNECKSASRNGLTVLTERRKNILSTLMKEMMANGVDFGTVAYCAQMLQDGWIDFAELVKPKEDDKKMDADQPFLGDPYQEMVFKHYYTGELLTVPQCIESGQDPFDLIHISGEFKGLPIRPQIIEKVTGLNLYQLVEKYPAKQTPNANVDLVILDGETLIN